MLHVVAVLIASACFATTGTSQALAGLDASPIAVGAARGLIGGALLSLVAYLAYRRPRFSPASGSTPAPPPWRAAVQQAKLPVAYGVIGVLAYNALFFAGTAMNGVAIGTVVAVGSAPVAAGLFEALVLREAPSSRWMLATAVAITGVGLVSGILAASSGGHHISIVGLVISIGAGSSYALYTIASKSLFDRGWNGTTAMGTLFGIAGLISVPILLVMDTAWIWSARGAALSLWLGVITVALAYSLWAWGLVGLRSTTVTTLTLAEPMGATLLGLLVLHETLSAPAALGVGLIAVGLLIVSIPQRRSEEPATLGI